MAGWVKITILNCAKRMLYLPEPFSLSSPTTRAIMKPMESEIKNCTNCTEIRTRFKRQSVLALATSQLDKPWESNLNRLSLIRRVVCFSISQPFLHCVLMHQNSYYFARTYGTPKSPDHVVVNPSMHSRNWIR